MASWFYDTALVKVLLGTGKSLQKLNNGSLSRYIAAAVIGAMGVAVIIITILVML